MFGLSDDRGDLSPETYLQCVHPEDRAIVRHAHEEALKNGVYDVTDHQALDGQLQHEKKMAALGELAAGIAHEFNNLLMVVEGPWRTPGEATAAGRCRRSVSRKHSPRVASGSVADTTAPGV